MMITSNIILGENVTVEVTSRLNNVKIGSNTKIAGNTNIYGSRENILEIGESCYFGPNCLIEGYNAAVKIGSFVSFGQDINLMSGSGPNASPCMQKLFPLIKGEVSIGDHTWVGTGSIIMPGINIGKFCVVAANSFVKSSFEDYSILAGTPAKLLRKLNKTEIEIIESK